MCWLCRRRFHVAFRFHQSITDMSLSTKLGSNTVGSRASKSRLSCQIECVSVVWVRCFSYTPINHRYVAVDEAEIEHCWFKSLETPALFHARSISREIKSVEQFRLRSISSTELSRFFFCVQFYRQQCQTVDTAHGAAD